MNGVCFNVNILSLLYYVINFVFCFRISKKLVFFFIGRFVILILRICFIILILWIVFWGGNFLLVLILRSLRCIWWFIIWLRCFFLLVMFSLVRLGWCICWLSIGIVVGCLVGRRYVYCYFWLCFEGGL